MIVEDIFDRTGQAYLCMIHPARKGNVYRQEIAPVLRLSASLPDELVSSMIAGGGWRERLLGVCMGMAKRPVSFLEPMLRSL